MAPVHKRIMTLEPNQSRKIQPMMGQIELTIASEALITLNWVLAMPNSLRRVFLKGPRELSVQFATRGNRTTQRSAIHLYVQGTLKATVSASTRT